MSKITHWEDCWKEHHKCAIAKIERLEKENTELKERLDHYQQIAQEAWFWSEE